MGDESGQEYRRRGPREIERVEALHCAEMEIIADVIVKRAEDERILR